MLGGKNFAKNLKKFHIKTVLVSGGFDLMAEVIAKDLEFDKFYANKLEVKDNYLTGKVYQPIISAKSKADILKKELSFYNLKGEDSLAIGDGFNDLLMLKEAGIGIAYYGKPKLKNAISHQINHTSLMSILYFLGISRQEFVNS